MLALAKNTNNRHIFEDCLQLSCIAYAHTKFVSIQCLPDHVENKQPFCHLLCANGHYSQR